MRTILNRMLRLLAVTVLVAGSATLVVAGPASAADAIQTFRNRSLQSRGRACFRVFQARPSGSTVIVLACLAEHQLSPLTLAVLLPQAS